MAFEHPAVANILRRLGGKVQEPVSQRHAAPADSDRVQGEKCRDTSQCREPYVRRMCRIKLWRKMIRDRSRASEKRRGSPSTRSG